MIPLCCENAKPNDDGVTNRGDDMLPDKLRTKKKVLIIHRIIAPYRIPFYEELKRRLSTMEIDLSLVYGCPRDNETDPYGDVDFGIQVPTRYVWQRKRFLVWLSALKYAMKADLVIVQASSTNLINYILIPLRKIAGFRLAFWGHGKNFQAINENSLKEQFKRIYSRCADHWFAYTELSVKAVTDLGFPKERITSVCNAIDTKEDIRFLESISSHEIRRLRGSLAIEDGAPVGIFCSRLYKDKNIGFLLDCVKEIRRRVQSFHFLLLGDGAESAAVRAFADANPAWFHWIGAKYGREKALFFSIANFQLLPGAVGLNIVDSFALLTPLITTDNGSHGPEIVYLENGQNGVMTENTKEAFIDGVIRVIEDKAYLVQLIKGCVKARGWYTVEHMAANFADGICRALSEGNR
jgi:L-malate glycosyltransferase